MAQVSFDFVNQASVNSNANSSRVSFFTLKDDGDEAIVRFMHDSTDSFDLVTTHSVTVGGKFRSVNCVRDPHEPLEKCPMCAAGIKVANRFYIHLICYEKDPQTGKMVGYPQVWERSLQYATQLKDLINEYGPLSESIFKIKRSGKAGSMETTYSIMYGNPAVYKPEIYVKDETAFEGYKAVGRVVLDKTPEEMTHFIATGEFPAASKSDEPVVSVPQAGFTPTPAMEHAVETAFNNGASYTSPSRNVPPKMPWESNTTGGFGGGTDRPVRRY